MEGSESEWKLGGLGTASWEGGEERSASSHSHGSCRHGVLSLWIRRYRANIKSESLR